MGFWWTDWRR